MESVSPEYKKRLEDLAGHLVLGRYATAPQVIVELAIEDNVVEIKLPPDPTPEAA